MQLRQEALRAPASVSGCLRSHAAMERRFPHLQNNPYLSSNPYLHNTGRRYPARSCGSTGPRSTSSWVLWEPCTSPPQHNPWCSFLTVLVLFLVILGVLAVAGLALYMGAYLIFDGSMRLLGDRYSNNLSNKSSNSFLEKSKRYQTLLEAAYAKSLLRPSVHEITINSFTNGSLIVFFRIILDRRKIPKPISSIEDTLKTVLLQEASSPLSVMNALKIDPKDLLIKRFLEDQKPHLGKEEPTTSAPIEKKKSDDSKVEVTSHWPTIAGEVKTLPSQRIQGTFTVTSDGKPKKPVVKEETAVVTPALVLSNRKQRPTEPPNSRFGMKHSPALKQYLHVNKTEPKTTEPTPTEPWRPMMPDERRDFNDKVDFDYGVGEAEVVVDSQSEGFGEGRKVTSVHKTTPGLVEEVPGTRPPDGTQKSMPELSILEQFHNLDTLLRSYTGSTIKTPVKDEKPAVVTLLPVRSNVGVRGTLRPRPLTESTKIDTSGVSPFLDESKHIDSDESDLVAIPLQKYFTSSPNHKEKDISFVTENLRGIAVLGTDDVDVSSQRDLTSKNRSNFSREPKMPKMEVIEPPQLVKSGPLDSEMKLLLEQIFQNMSTTARALRNTSVDFSPQIFNLNSTFFLKKLAKVQVDSVAGNSSNRFKVSNKAIATRFPGNDSPFLLMTKVYNKAPKPQETKNVSHFEATECTGNNSILCGSGECIPSLLKCNKLMDCRDGSDETNCTCADFLRNHYHSRKLCDGIFDCWDLSDEQNCDWCTPGQHICSNSKMCIDASQVCDGFPHCPYGDDERNCLTVATSLETADNKDYQPSGYVMVRKEGEWGKMCLQNFDNVISQSKDWSIEDLGKSVCRSLTYKNFDGIQRTKDATPHFAPVYYELAVDPDKNQSYKRSTNDQFSFQKSTCIEKEVAEVKCSGLECGIRPEASATWANERRSRIVGGGNAGPGAWPWQAALYKEGEFQCGATLISNTWLLSAGHCFYNALREYWLARLGALRRGTPPAPYEQLRPISKIILHPNYQDQGFINDISLLKMSSPVSLTTFVRPICLPTREPRNGAMCTVVGWGQLFEVARVFPDTLQEVQLPVISTSECRKRTIFLPLYKVTDNMFCAGYERGGRDACLGDSGGPLMCQENDGRWTLNGVTSNGYGCARANRPGVYTKVINYLPWVEQVIENEVDDSGPPICHGHRCPLGECLPPARLCNGYIECRDSSDEKGCW